MTRFRRPLSSVKSQSADKRQAKPAALLEDKPPGDAVRDQLTAFELSRGTIRFTAAARHLRMLLAEGRLPECWIPPGRILECRALLETYHDLRAEQTTDGCRYPAATADHPAQKGHPPEPLNRIHCGGDA